MDVRRAIRTATAWSRGEEGRALTKLARDKVIVDERHRFRLICEVVLERQWLRDHLKADETGEKGKYSQEDYADFDCLLEVIINSELGDDLNGYC